MVNESTLTSTPELTARVYVPAKQVYLMAAIFLVAGLAIGFVWRGQQPPVAPKQVAAASATTVPPGHAMGTNHVPNLGELKQMADTQAAPLLEKLKNDPKNSALLLQVAAIYHTTHRFKEAAAYYQQAVDIDPESVAARTKLAISLYRGGDADGALVQLNKALTYDPKDANALFNVGMIKLEGKKDGKGAVAAWQRLLKSNPQLSADRKAQVQALMANVLTSLGNQNASGGRRP